MHFSKLTLSLPFEYLKWIVWVDEAWYSYREGGLALLCWKKESFGYAPPSKRGKITSLCRNTNLPQELYRSFSILSCDLAISSTNAG
jgi:hypothetical protein